MTRGRILVVDDEPAMLENVDRILGGEGYEVAVLADSRRFRDVAAQSQPDVVICDLRMPGADGMTILAASLADEPSRPVVLMTAFGSIASAVAAIREGAFDFIAKPFSVGEFLVVVERAMRWRGLTKENLELRARVAERDSDGILGSSALIQNLLDQARRVAPGTANVLLTGESGTGKELFARFIHARSGRERRAMVIVDCAAMPEGLLESELFGYQRGAFTGATRTHAGLLEHANGSTVFLDEVAELPLALQAKLLRALEQRQIRRLGDTRTIDLDVRVIAATNRDLVSSVQAGQFREDLYYRLNVVHFELPPLRAREGDIPILLASMLRDLAVDAGSAAPVVTPEAWEVLERYPWPGNVRELRNIAQRLVALDDDGRITVGDLPPLIASASARTTLPPAPQSFAAAQGEAMTRFRADYVRTVLEQNRGNVSAAARSAGVSRRTFHRWLAGLRPESEGSA